MSYCRWSSDDFACDVYVYGSSRGYEIHVAANRHVPKEPMPPPLPEPFDPHAYVGRHQEVMRIIKGADRRPIGLPLDGETFVERAPEDAADRLEEVRAAGYNVPQYVIDDLREEADTPP